MERLYYRDAYIKKFEAKIIERLVRNGGPAVVLDRTAFYPTFGGQPNDTGSLNDVKVVDVVEEDEKVIHLLEKEVAGELVRGVIDWDRRFDHMQQHTGQHILSQAFLNLTGAETIGFHLGETVSDIDLNIGSISENLLWKAEGLANAIVQQDLALKIIFADEAGLAAYHLRKEPDRRGKVRIIEIEDFDASPCGGTHLRSTGEAGIIKIRKWEKVGSRTRIDFYCGMRALLDYRWKNSFINTCALRFTTGEKELGEAIGRLEEESKRLKKELKDARESLIAYEADEILGKAEVVKGFKVVRQIFEGRDLQEVKILSSLLKKKGRVVALFGIRGEGASLLFARSDDLDVDLSAILKKSIGLIGGKGGGRPDSAQGGGPDIASLDQALDHAYSLIVESLP